jgi:competence protein ComEC
VSVPTLLVAIPLTAGCAWGLLLGSPGPLLALCTAASALLAVLSAVTAVALGDERMPVAGVVVGSVLAGISLGISSALHAYGSPLESWFSAAGRSVHSPVVVRGVLREDAARTATGVSLVIDVVSAAGVSGGALGGVRLGVVGTLAGAGMDEWRAGRSVQVPATLRRPVTHRNPGVPDEARALQRRGIALVGSAKSGALVEITAPGSARQEGAAGVRAWVRRALADTVGAWSQRSAGVAAAIVIGDRTGLDEADEQRLLRAGTYHVIAISGGNIAILTVMLLGVLRWLRASPRVAAGIAIPILLVYGQTAGSAPSVQRALAAATLYLTGRLLEHRTPAPNVLAVAAVLALGAVPSAVVDPGFVLSFGATLGILVVMPRVSQWMGKPSVRVARPAVALLAATMAVELVLGPLSAVMFARVTCAGLLLNFAAIPSMAVVQMASMGALATVSVAPAFAIWCGYIAHLAAAALIDSSWLVDLAPWMVRDVAPPSWWLVSAYYGALAVCLRARSHVRTRLAAVVLAATIVAGPHALSRDGIASVPDDHLRVVFLDVGQGDATLVQLADGRALLVDAGGLPSAPPQDPRYGPSFDIGARVVARALRALGVRKLEAFVLTHADPDHIGGAPSVLREFRPWSVWDGVPVPRHAPLRTLERIATDLPAEWRTVRAGDRVALGEVEIVALHPPPPDWERQRVRNDDSVVLAVRYRDVSVILPGDIGREGESAVLRHVSRTPMVILKAPHHGSATSSTPAFLSAVGPRVVVFSAGRDNRFNHPAPGVVARYRDLDTAIFSTAEDGAVILETDGRGVFIRGWTGRTAYYRVR